MIIPPRNPSNPTCPPSISKRKKLINRRMHCVPNDRRIPGEPFPHTSLWSWIFLIPLFCLFLQAASAFAADKYVIHLEKCDTISGELLSESIDRIVIQTP